jgi:hypothetical protein
LLPAQCGQVVKTILALHQALQIPLAPLAQQAAAFRFGSQWHPVTGNLPAQGQQPGNQADLLLHGPAALLAACLGGQHLQTGQPGAGRPVWPATWRQSPHRPNGPARRPQRRAVFFHHPQYGRDILLARVSKSKLWRGVSLWPCPRQSNNQHCQPRAARWLASGAQLR